MVKGSRKSVVCFQYTIASTSKNSTICLAQKVVNGFPLPVEQSLPQYSRLQRSSPDKPFQPYLLPVPHCMSGIPNYKSFFNILFSFTPLDFNFSILNAYPSIKTELNVTGLNSGKVSDNRFKIHKAVECLLSIQIV